jgi:hypothetical protein
MKLFLKHHLTRRAKAVSKRLGIATPPDLRNNPAK